LRVLDSVAKSMNVKTLINKTGGLVIDCTRRPLFKLLGIGNNFYTRCVFKNANTRLFVRKKITSSVHKIKFDNFNS
jgi:hypothetical protein